MEGKNDSLEVFLPGRKLGTSLEDILLQWRLPQKLDQRKLQDFKKSSKNVVKIVCKYEISV